jgi:DNA polymerase III epsilon subunit-like protein
VYLFFDTETTGLPKNYRAPVHDSANWPRMVQLAWGLWDQDGVEQCGDQHIIRPEGYCIPDVVAKIHGITTEIATRDGLDLGEVLISLLPVFQDAPVVLAHNIEFDRKILGAEFFRKGFGDPLEGKDLRCTMKESARFCALPRNKWPKLAELHTCLFKEGFDNAHNALADVRACARCFFEMKRRGVAPALTRGPAC